jgi:hypothetical protein
MTTNIEDSQEKYKNQLSVINEFRKKLTELGFEIKSRDEFELGGEWEIYFSGQEVAEFMWNVPYYLSFIPKISQKEQAFDIDNVKNIDDWQSIVNDVLVSVSSTKELGK